MSAPLPPRSLRLAIDHGALARNWKTLDQLSGKARAGAAVKADAYGLGAAAVVKTLSAVGCADFLVAHWSEAAALDGLLPPGALSVLHGPITTDDVAYAIVSGIRPVINSLDQAARWLAAGGGTCDIMIDTGINRIGLAMGDLGDPLLARLDVAVLMSHLASADEDSPLNELQRRRWIEARQMVRHQRASLANSAGITLGEDFHGDLTRPGLAIYGGVPCAALEGRIGPVVTPQAAVIQTRQLEPGDSVGYNATFVAGAAMRIGIVSIGYADGYLRCWSDTGAFCAGERILPVIGRVSMDMTAIDLSAAPEIGEGDWVSARYDLPTAAAASGLSQYELLTVLGQRFARIAA